MGRNTVENGEVRSNNGDGNGRQGGIWRSRTFGGLVPVAGVHAAILVLGTTGADQDGVVGMGLDMLLEILRTLE